MPAFVYSSTTPVSSSQPRPIIGVLLMTTDEANRRRRELSLVLTRTRSILNETWMLLYAMERFCEPAKTGDRARTDGRTAGAGEGASVVFLHADRRR